SELFGSSIDGLHKALSSEPRGQSSHWAEAVYTALEQIAAAINAEVGDAKEIATEVGDINPALQHAPSTERNAEKARDQLIELGEQVHLLRASIRQGLETKLQDVSQWRLQAQEIIAALQEVRKQEEKLVLSSINTDVGAGE